ncbi:MAG: YHYH protein [Saprospiraceae bacterium]
MKFIKPFQPTSILCLLCFIALISCDNSDDQEVIVEPTNQETINLANLPFGGNNPTNILIRNQGNSQPEILSLWLCGLPPDGAGNSDATDWTNADGSWDYTKKPQVEGNVTWISEFDVSLDGNGNRIITGNALPDHPTGVFPITPGSEAYQYDGNPNIISEHEVLYTFSEIPEIAPEPSCVFFGPSGISLSGSAIYHGASTLGNDAAAHEMLDRFGGHTDGTERYHYHFPSEDLQDHIHPHTSGHSALMGYMLDGFGIYGPHGEDGELLSSEDLDECHGHTHSVLWDGEMIDLYHYHWTYDFPYNIGCFKGTPQ